MGQRVILRDGRMADVCSVGVGPYNLIGIKRSGCSDLHPTNHCYDDGKCYADSSQTDSRDIVANGDLTLPLKVDQRVLCRDGKVRKVASIHSGAAYFDDHCCVFTDTGFGNLIPTNIKDYDAFADADD